LCVALKKLIRVYTIQVPDTYIVLELRKYKRVQVCDWAL